MTPMDKKQSLAFVRRAFDAGVRHFDTASIYGQGDSERILGEALHGMRDHVSVSTKAGQRLTPKQQLLRPLKPLVRRLLHRGSAGPSPAGAPAAPSGIGAGMVAAQRARGVNHCFEPAFVLRSLKDSLRRLRTGQVDLFYLHSPPAEALLDPAVWAACAQARQAGLFAKLGVSCDDLATAEAALQCAAVEVLQFQPDGSAQSMSVLRAASARGVVVHGRMGALHDDSASARLAALLAQPAVGAVVIGTTRADHLAQNLALFADASAAANERPSC
jgi:aryl-alcohol dehydrogenase-like predicted oxidoreductase